MRTPNGRLTLPTIGLLVAVLALGAVAAPAQADDDPTVSDPTATSTPADDAAAQAATAALEQVQAILDPTAAQVADQATASTDDTPDLTVALRDLRLRQDDLTARQRATAQRLVPSRPLSDSAPHKDFPSANGRGVRVHWAADDTSIPPSGGTWVDQVGSVVSHVLSTYQAAGYRAPESDGTQGGGNGLLDVYLIELGSSRIYGYCDAAVTPPSKGPYDTSAYCAFDHDFTDFPALPPLENLKVTAAHELFHATQFAYDYTEDAWFMEATAAWAEDEVYDDINDNRQYLPLSPLRQPRQSLDQFSDSLRQYGEWIFFRYLTERFPKSQGGLPTIMRQMWQRVDASRGGRDNYSIQAVSRELAARGTSLRRVYAQFGDANRRPARAYEEGAAYPSAPATRSWTFTPRQHDTTWQHIRVDHLATATMQVKPSAAMRHWRVRVAVDLPNTATGVAAIVTRYAANGRVSSKMVRLSRAGNGRAVAMFDAHSTRRVDVTLSNAGIDYRRCWHGPARNGVTYSCSGISEDDNRLMSFRVSAVR